MKSLLSAVLVDESAPSTNGSSPVFDLESLTSATLLVERLKTRRGLSNTSANVMWNCRIGASGGC
jgi:hypothetical protein